MRRNITIGYLVSLVTMTLTTTLGMEDQNRNIMKGYDSPPIGTELVEELGSDSEWFSDVIQVTDINYINGMDCTCGFPRDVWNSWSTCSPRFEKCYRATQTRRRNCPSNCGRIQVRYCYSPDTCRGQWSDWVLLNSTCDVCGVTGLRTLLRFCKSDKNIIGPYCKGSKGKDFQIREESCFRNCAEEEPPLGPPDFAIQEDGGFVYPQHITDEVRDVSDQQEPLSSGSHLIIILLAVVAGVLLLALLFVVCLLGAARRRKKDHRGSMSRDFRSISESNISATSYLSAGDKDSRFSGRTSLYQQNKSGRRRSMISPTSMANMSINGPGSVRVRGPMQHTDSLMLTRKQIPVKRPNKGSLRSINKVIKERSRSDHNEKVEEVGETFFIGSINLRGDGEVVVTSDNIERKNARKRRVALNDANLNEKEGVEKGCFDEDMKEDDTKDKASSTGGRDSEGTPSLNGSSHESDMETIPRSGSDKKRPSVEDIRKIFESHSDEHAPITRPHSKTTSDIPCVAVVERNISRFERASLPTRNNWESIGRLKRSNTRSGAENGPVGGERSVESYRVLPNQIGPSSSDHARITNREGANIVTSSVVQNTNGSLTENGRSAQNNGNDTVYGSNSINIKKQRPKNLVSPPVLDANSAYNSNTAQPKKRTFLFSSQAFTSLQRSANGGANGGAHDIKTSPGKQGFKMDFDALFKTSNGENRKSGVSQQFKPGTPETHRPRSYQDNTVNPIIAPRPRGVLRSTDSDTYADVWDAKDKLAITESLGDSNVYADVWNSERRGSRKSICEDDDGDYSEVYDAMDSGNVIRARIYAMGTQTVGRKRYTSQGTPPSSGHQSPKTRQAFRTTSAGSSPVNSLKIRSPFIRERNRQISRESSTGSDGSTPNERYSGFIPGTPTTQQKRRSVNIILNPTGQEETEDPIYSVI